MEQRTRNGRKAALALLATGIAIVLIPTAVFLLAPPGSFALASTALLSLWFSGVAVRATRRPSQNALLALASVLFCLAIGEAGAWFLNHSGNRERRVVETVRIVDDPDLGFRPLPNQWAEAEATMGARRLFRVEYSFGKDGLRPTPRPQAASCRAVFFVDSYAFGYGLPDEDALPAAFVRWTHGLYAADNFSFNGYGPHQMLRAIEAGRLDRVLRGSAVDLVIYEGILNHLARAAGRALWDQGGPKYAIGGDGRTRYLGRFHDAAYRTVIRFFGERSQLFRMVARTTLVTDRPAAEDLPLYVAILETTKAEIARRYAAKFVILFWDTDRDVSSWPMSRDGDLAQSALRRLDEAGLSPIPITRIVPDINVHRPAYAISEFDPHPNKAANERIAEYLAGDVAPQHCGHSAARPSLQRAEDAHARQ
jgi:hypothetical protein